MVEIEFNNKTQNNVRIWEQLATSIFEKAYSILKIKHKISVGVLFLNSADAKNANKAFRHKEYIPDVLSFPVNFSKKEIKSLGFEEIGDIYICLEEAEKKSIKYDHTIQQEMAFLFVHGFLHLLGFDHELNLREEKKMFKLQDKILNSLNIKYEIKFHESDYVEEGL